MLWFHDMYNLIPCDIIWFHLIPFDSMATKIALPAQALGEVRHPDLWDHLQQVFLIVRWNMDQEPVSFLSVCTHGNKTSLPHCQETWNLAQELCSACILSSRAPLTRDFKLGSRALQWLYPFFMWMHPGQALATTPRCRLARSMLRTTPGCRWIPSWKLGES